MKPIVSDLTLHNDLSENVLATDLIDWAKKQNPWRTFNVTRYSWMIGKQVISLSCIGFYICLLPDSSGFIAFESAHVPNNCTLLDVYGKERMRLTVPRHLTGGLVDPSYETGAGTFIGISEPYVNPKTGTQGQFGVEAYVEEGRFYFELNYHTGEFLWGRQIRD